MLILRRSKARSFPFVFQLEFVVQLEIPILAKLASIFPSSSSAGCTLIMKMPRIPTAKAICSRFVKGKDGDDDDDKALGCLHFSLVKFK